jgi:ribosomal protein S6
MPEISEEKKQYEVSFLLRKEEDVPKLVKNLEEAGAQIIERGRVSEIRLAYPVRKERSALFGYIIFEAPAEKIKGLSDRLTLDKDILRFLIVTPAHGKITVQPAERPKPKEVEPEKPEEPKEATAETFDDKSPETGIKEKEVSSEELDKKLEEILK